MKGSDTRGSEFDRKWILAKGIPEVLSYSRQGIDLTIRALHYRLVGMGMTNDIKHYKKVVAAMTHARWEGMLNMDAFVDQDRFVVGSTMYEETILEDEVSYGKDQVKAWMQNYSKNRWENQETYVEVFIEKKALQAVFEQPCMEAKVALSPCKGYPSLTFLHDASIRFEEAIGEGKRPVILYFGDYDPSGEDIPRSIQENLARMGCRIELERIALMEEQVVKWNLPPAPAKKTDSRSANWDGIGQVELDAVEPIQLQNLVSDAISSYFDEEMYEQLLVQQSEERLQYQRQLKEYVQGL